MSSKNDSTTPLSHRASLTEFSSSSAFPRSTPLSPKEIIEKYAGTVPPRPAALQASLAMATAANNNNNSAINISSPLSSNSSASSSSSSAAAMNSNSIPPNIVTTSPLPSHLLQDSSLLLGSTLMTAGCRTVFTPSPLSTTMELIYELQLSQLDFLKQFRSVTDEFQSNIDLPLYDSSIQSVYNSIPNYTQKCQQLNQRGQLVKKKLLKLRQKSELLAESIVEEAKQKALKRAQMANGNGNNMNTNNNNNESSTTVSSSVSYNPI